MSEVSDKGTVSKAAAKPPTAAKAKAFDDKAMKARDKQRAAQAKEREENSGTLELVCGHVDAEAALASAHRHWPKNLQPGDRKPPTEIQTYSYRGTPLGKNDENLSVAVVGNCLSEVDAQHAYFAHYDRSPLKRPVKVELET